MLYSPLRLVTRLMATLVSTLTAVTVAPGTTAPVVSDTLPTSEAVSNWPQDLPDQAAKHSIKSTSRFLIRMRQSPKATASLLKVRGLNRSTRWFFPRGVEQESPAVALGHNTGLAQGAERHGRCGDAEDMRDAPAAGIGRTRHPETARGVCRKIDTVADTRGAGDVAQRVGDIGATVRAFHCRIRVRAGCTRLEARIYRDFAVGCGA